MEVIGTGACRGVVKGTLFVYERPESTDNSITISDVSREVNRFLNAKDAAKEELQRLYEQVVSDVGEEGASIFKAQSVLFDDSELIDSVISIIREEKLNSENAIKKAGNHFYQLYSVLEDEFMHQRAADILDVVSRIVGILDNMPDYGIELTEPCIVLADELTPTETIQLDKSKVLGFVTRFGSTNSHTSVLARTMNVPAIVCAEFPADCNGKIGIVDGDAGLLIINPNESDVAEFEIKLNNVMVKQEELEELKGLSDVTKSGKKINLYANIGGVEDLPLVVKNDSAGIGLFRTEFIYLQSDGMPSEEELFFTYQTVAKTMGEKPVVIRTMDIGADKTTDYFDLAEEANPALGYRGIRVSLDMLDVFEIELRAILRASAYGNFSIMLPLVTSVTEVLRVKLLIEKIKKELDEEGAEYKQVLLGVMIETPAAVMIANELAAEVDFLSVGTNDLTQYTLVADRQNPRLESLYDSKHPAILRMLNMVADAGHSNGCTVGICGELAGDVNMTQTLISMGFDTLSVSPGKVLEIREAIRECE